MVERDILKVLTKLKTDPYLLARHSLFVYACLFQRDVEPNYNYSDKFFTILANEFEYFIKTNNYNLALLEASPRTGKTEFVINVVLSYLIGVNNKKRFLLVAGNQTLKKKLRRLLVRVAISPFYKNIFGNVKIIRQNDSEIILSNNCLINFTTTNSMTPTGEGYHFIFMIDFLNRTMINSQARLENAFEQAKGVLSRTQNDPSTKLIVDNQRLGLEDFSHYLTKQYQEAKMPYLRLTFPYQFKEATTYALQGKISTITFKEKEYLVSRFNDIERQKIIANLGTYVYETEYQQNPIEIEGLFIKRDYFGWYSGVDLQNLKFSNVFITADTAWKSKDKSDYSVFCAWGVANERLYLLDMKRGKYEGVDLDNQAKLFYGKWKARGVSAFYIEDAASGIGLVQRFRQNMDLKFIVRGITRVSDKFTRCKQVLGYIADYRVALPDCSVKIQGIFDTQKDIAEPFLTEVCSFTKNNKHKHDDIADCLFDACVVAFSKETLDFTKFENFAF